MHARGTQRRRRARSLAVLNADRRGRALLVLLPLGTARRYALLPLWRAACSLCSYCLVCDVLELLSMAPARLKRQHQPAALRMRAPGRRAFVWQPAASPVSAPASVARASSDARARAARPSCPTSSRPPSSSRAWTSSSRRSCSSRRRWRARRPPWLRVPHCLACPRTCLPTHGPGHMPKVRGSASVTRVPPCDGRGRAR